LYQRVHQQTVLFTSYTEECIVTVLNPGEKLSQPIHTENNSVH